MKNNPKNQSYQKTQSTNRIKKTATKKPAKKAQPKSRITTSQPKAPTAPPTAPTKLEAERVGRTFGLQDVSACKNVNEVMEHLKIGNYSQTAIPEVCNGYSVIRDDLENPVAIVSDTYDLLQPIETFAFMDALCNSMNIQFTKAGFTHGGRRMFIQAEYGEVKIEHGKRKVGDILKRRITATGSFDGTTSTKLEGSMHRVWCSNQMANWVADRNKSIKVRHTRNQRVVFAQALEQATGMKQVFVNFQADINKLNKTKMTEKQMHLVATKYLKLEGKETGEIGSRAMNNHATLLNEFANEERGTFGVTAWDAMNAFTAYQTHERSYRETKSTSREENRFRVLSKERAVAKFRNLVTEVVGV